MRLCGRVSGAWGGFRLDLREAVHFREKLAGTMDRGAWHPGSLGSAGLCKEVACWQVAAGESLECPHTSTLPHLLLRGQDFTL